MATWLRWWMVCAAGISAAGISAAGISAAGISAAGIRKGWAGELPRSGMILHLDAAHLTGPLANSEAESQTESQVTSGPNTAPGQQPDPVTPAKETVARWLDRSAAGREFLQPANESQPHRVVISGSPLVRFDGRDDYLLCTSPAGTADAATDALTLFIVAAPHENLGGFASLFATSAAGEHDYQSGLNLDLGPAATRQLESINVEGAGFGGARNLFSGPGLSFGTLHVMQCVIDPDREQVEVSVDDLPAAVRPKQPGPIALHDWAIGARLLNNAAGQRQMRGFLNGDIAEVVAWNRVLSPEERKQVLGYLQSKHAAVAEALRDSLHASDPGVPLVRIEDAPLVQMLMPGFTVRELPLELTNVNNVRYRHDGRLVTLGYNGDIHLLSDTDGDGLEDQASVFWKNAGSVRGPLGLLLTGEEDPRGNAAFVPSKGKVSMFVDRDDDDVADEEVVVAQGWKEIPQNVDAVGIAMDSTGAIYFGLGTADFADAYQIDDQGQAHYDLSSERGTVQRIAPDLQSRETVCTGVRFPVAMAFNTDGDLFCTDQEGVPWLPNGNPLDELLHIVRDRHYGFPPCHPRHNPEVIDEPSVFDYAPQHQSTCGMFFNDAAAGQPIFGPESWRGNAIVCGQSRGKLYRTQLAKTPAGYVATTQLLARLQMLTVDACLAPNGDIIVACHSGPPDWGTGPTGVGKLFRISYDAPPQPSVVATWAENQREVRVALDRPIDPAQLKDALPGVRIDYGTNVRAGDALENLSPPYAVVQRQGVQPRYVLGVHAIGVSSDRRTLILNTEPMQEDVHYAVTLPLTLAAHAEVPSAEAYHPVALEQLPRLDVDYDLRGVTAQWVPDDASEASLGCWLPHANWRVSVRWLHGSSTHENFFAAVAKGGGELHISTKLNVQDILRPAVQMGAQIDYQWPDEEVYVQVDGASQVEILGEAKDIVQVDSPNAQRGHRLTVNAADDPWLPLSIRVRLAAGETPSVALSLSTNEDPRPRAIPVHRFGLPWLNAARTGVNEVTAPDTARIAEIEGGNWGKGRRVFHSQAAGCFKCHALQGAGAKLGPDLGNLRFRDYASVLRDIEHPSFSINPDYVGHVVLLRDGSVLTGVLRSKDGATVIGNQLGEERVLDNDQIERIKPVELSVMPTGTLEQLSAEQRRDLMTYLLTAPPQMPLDSPLSAPPLRTASEVAAKLQGSQPLPVPLQPMKIVLVAGAKDHGPGEHDYPAWLAQWGQLMSAAPAVEVNAAWDFPSDEQCAAADLLVFFQKGTWNDERQSKMDKFFARGGGAVYVHWAVNGDERVADFSRRIGLASQGGRAGYRHGPLDLQIHSTEHPIVRNFDRLELYDESYWKLAGDPQQVTLLGTSHEEGEPRPQLWTYERGAGRVFVSIPGHYNWTFDDPLFRIILLRGMAWTARQPVDRFNELVPLGARMTQ